jgi:O-antigen/teichoic acid export membrane protein
LNIRRLLLATVVYGVSDVIVLAVGGLLLLPLYTRTLSQAEFGVYVIVRANAEIFTYVLYFGLPSAVGRIYFDHRKSGRQFEYLSSIVNFYALSCACCAAVCLLWGEQIWHALSPRAPVQPYLWFTFGLAAVSFFATLGALLLRLEGRARAFAAVQIGASGILAAAAVINLLGLHDGLPGLLSALLISSVCSSAVLPVLMMRRYQPVIRWQHVVESLRLAIPILAGYIAYFVLNRISTLILQRRLPVEQVAIFGLAQQLATIITIAGAAFAKALQPTVFEAEPAVVVSVLQRSAVVQILLMSGITMGAVLFAQEGLAIVAPARYASAYYPFLVLALAALVYSFSLIADTALLYYRRAVASLAVSLLGGGMAAGLSFALIPRYELRGAAAAIAVAFAAKTVTGQWLYRRQTGHSSLGLMLLALMVTAAVAILGAWLRESGLPVLDVVCLKVGIVAIGGSVVFVLYRRLRPSASAGAAPRHG